MIRRETMKNSKKKNLKLDDEQYKLVYSLLLDRRMEINQSATKNANMMNDLKNTNILIAIMANNLNK